MGSAAYGPNFCFSFASVINSGLVIIYRISHLFMANRGHGLVTIPLAFISVIVLLLAFMYLIMTLRRPNLI